MANNPFLHEEEYRGKLDKLNDWNILVCGAGAIGSNLVHNLVRHGATNIAVLDKDRVEKHNLGTQTWTDDDIGMTKVEALSNQIYAINETNLVFSYKELTEKNVRKLLKGYDIVVDCFDNNAARKTLKDYCDKAGIPCLHGGLFEDYGEVYWNEFYTVPEDVEDGDVCDYPLARNIIMLVVIAMTEEILNCCLYSFDSSKKPRNFNITLKDMRISTV